MVERVSRTLLDSPRGSMARGDSISAPTCFALSPGRMDYLPAWELQKSLREEVARGSIPDLILLLEHPHVYTLGRRGKTTDVLASPQSLRRLGAEVHEVDRGGEVTYHGPGQLVGYPIIDLRRWGGPLKYVRALEACLMATLADLGVSAHSDGRPTGVWAGDAKIAAIGVKVSRGVTTHGFARNVNPDLSYFDHIVPCGMPDARVSSMTSVLSEDVQVEDVIPVLVRQFGETFGRRMEWSTLDQLYAGPPLAGAVP